MCDAPPLCSDAELQQLEGHLLKQWIDVQLSLLRDLQATWPDPVDAALVQRLARASDRLDEALDVLAATR